ncbi:PLDc N-terminal domain-containing protein [Microbacterium sp. Marseille-Q6965]|uniref:PLDc N-terminal domain-containing protein n=1 Tax=Microbacterium sp. Marseille-Q6965 TaxID=2965072 RepID=UPI0021B755CA|nr:PLDc N-terminal domain-containing protein [Microbacterium sp. Marseille-Q6965]
MNPLVPTRIDAIGMAAALAALALAIAAVLSILRAPGLGAAARPLWVLVAVFVPVVGPLAWFAAAAGRAPGTRA